MTDHENDPTPDAVDLGPKPDAETEPGEPNPGGVDAIADSDGVDPAASDGEPVPRDLDPEGHPDTGEIPVEVKQGEDTSTEATEGEGSEGDSYDSDDAADEVETE